MFYAQMISAAPRMSVLILSQPRGRAPIAIIGLAPAEMDTIAARFLQVTIGPCVPAARLQAVITQVCATSFRSYIVPALDLAL
jgi:hypothetical protein